MTLAPPTSSTPSLVAAQVAVIVVTYRSLPLIDRCLQSAVAAGAGEIWVVDNASDDGTADHVARHHPEVRLIRAAGNLGFAAANNLALRQIETPYALLLNPDAWLEPDALETMAVVLRDHPDIALVGPSIDRQGVAEPSLLAAPTAVGAWLFLLSGMRSFATGGFAGLTAAGYPWRDLAEGDHLRGSCMLIRMAATTDVGWLDEAFFLYFEETEWCLRFRRKGWRVAIAPEAQAHHIGKASVQTQDSLPSLEYMRSAVLFWQKIHPKPAQWLLRATLALMALAKGVLLFGKPDTAPRRRWLFSVARLALDPYALPITYDGAVRPKNWRPL